MPELRKDPISGHCVLIAEGRAARPNDFAQHPLPAASHAACPFCPGQEHQTPPESLAYREADSLADAPGWRLRVVPNKYPAVEGAGPAERRHEGLYDSITGVGVHEVIIETPRHVSSCTELTASEFGEVLRAYRDRLLFLAGEPHLAYAQLFKNVGAAAGASLEHAHSQLVALPVTPPALAEELANSRAWFRDHDQCIFCHLVQQELAAGERIVLESPRFVACCPYASRFPYETWVLPKAHASRFEDADAETRRELAVVLRQTIARMETVLDRPAYNYWLHTAPLREPESPHFHWHFEVTPRLTNQAGFEWGTGIFINAVSPEAAAARLRRAPDGCR